jgi:folate-binding protein YgfZ
MPDFDTQYAAFTSAAGWCDCNERTQIELIGDDRATFLHNFTTNDIRGLKPGGGCEAFALDARGHVLGHLLVFCTQHSLVIDTVPGQAETLCRHLDRYLIRERVEIHDRGEAWGELALAGAEAGQLLHELTGAVLESPYSHAQVQLAGHQLWLRRVDIFGPGSYFLAGPREAMDAVGLVLEAEGIVPCGNDVLETVRIESGFPWYGRDISISNLPQEAARDRQAINFNKGCYLGQETVARIDALGHVNKTLACVRFSGQTVPPVGTELRSGDQPVGAVTSAAFSPLLNAPLALAYIRRGQNSMGAKLDSQFGAVVVIDAPRKAG